MCHDESWVKERCWSVLKVFGKLIKSSSLVTKARIKCQADIWDKYLLYGNCFAEVTVQLSSQWDFYLQKIQVWLASKKLWTLSTDQRHLLWWKPKYHLTKMPLCSLQCHLAAVPFGKHCSFSLRAPKGVVYSLAFTRLVLHFISLPAACVVVQEETAIRAPVVDFLWQRTEHWKLQSLCASMLSMLAFYQRKETAVVPSAQTRFQQLLCPFASPVADCWIVHEGGSQQTRTTTTNHVPFHYDDTLFRSSFICVNSSGSFALLRELTSSFFFSAPVQRLVWHENITFL